MVSYQSAVRVSRPPDSVFRYLVEPQKQALWSDVPMTPLTEGPLRAGSRMEITFGMGPIKAIVGLEISALESNARMAFRTFSGPIKWTGEYRLTPADGGEETDLSQKGTLEFTGLWRLVQPVVGAEIRNGEVKELEKLKAAAEAGL